MKTRRQENKTILSQAQNVSDRTIVSYRLVFLYSRILVFPKT